jgi:hypothetical protein
LTVGRLLVGLLVVIAVTAVATSIRLATNHGQLSGVAAPSGGVSSQEASHATTAAAPLGSCSVYEYGSDLKVTFDGPAMGAASCQGVAQKWSGGGGYYTLNDPSPSATRRIVCRLVYPSRDLEATVYDSGGAFNGTTICGTLTHGGWQQAGG